MTIYQILLDLQPGAVYVGQCQVWAYSGSFDRESRSEAWVHQRMGVDLTSDIDPDAPHVLWGPVHSNMIWEQADLVGDVYSNYSVYDPVVVMFVAQNTAATIFVQAVLSEPKPQTEWFVDACSVKAIGWAEDFGLSE